MSFPQHNISRPRHNITSPEVNMMLPRINISGYCISSRSHCFICLGHRGRPLPGTYICVWAALKKSVLTQPVFTVYPITQNKGSSMYRSANSHNNGSYILDVALAHTAHHCSSQLGDTDAIPYIVITEESNINVCFILYTSTIRTTFYELLL